MITIIQTILKKIKIHSFIDVITQRSTELFICDTDKTVEFVREVLQSYLNAINTMFDENDPWYYSNIDQICNIYYGSTKDALDGWADYYSSDLDNALIIEGTSDNSIPYEMWEFINETFNGNNYHLG